jgi:TetR/AcrR family transcriptional regulator
LEDILKNMDEEKRDRIINSAIDEFAKYPYAKASTNNIVENAGISKGLLFHYFGNKKDLYEKLSRFVLNKLSDEIMANIDWDQTDILERIKQLAIFKMKLGEKYPTMFEFIIKILAEKKTQSIESVIELYEEYGVDIQKLLGDVYARNIDFSMFRDQASIDKSLNIIRWTLEKYAEEMLVQVSSLDKRDYEKIGSDMDVYIDVLRKAFY